MLFCQGGRRPNACAPALETIAWVLQSWICGFTFQSCLRCAISATLIESLWGLNELMLIKHNALHKVSNWIEDGLKCCLVWENERVVIFCQSEANETKPQVLTCRNLSQMYSEEDILTPVDSDHFHFSFWLLLYHICPGITQHWRTAGISGFQLWELELRMFSLG